MTADVLMLSWLLATQSGAAAHPASELVGRWRGTSICTKADWNAACHDETALYDFNEGDAPGHVVSKGYKVVNGKPEYMGDLDFSYDETARAWVAEYSGPRVQTRWIFEPHGDDLNGRAVALPSMRVARTIHITRQTSR
jgi:hypothetical protein